MRYTLMHKEQPVLDMVMDEITGGILEIGSVQAPRHLPVGISMQDGAVDRADLNHWWLGRSIPASRSGIRDVLEHLGFATPQMLLAKCFGLSLSDQYWVKPDDRELRWQNINFFDNTFSEDVGNILFGMPPTGDGIDLLSPDNTSDGMLRKRWKIMDGTRCMIKGGSPPFYQEPLNEVFATRLMGRLGVEHVPYRLTWINELPYSVCPDFITADTELVSAHHIRKIMERAPEATKYRHFLDCCDALGIPGMQEHIDRMLVVDFLLANEDRHMNNFGAVRDANTLEWLGPAPIFDCGTSLWHDNLFRWGATAEDEPSRPFADRHSQQIRLVSSFGWLDWQALDGAEQELEEILESAPRYMDDSRIEILCGSFRRRVELLQELVMELGIDNGPTQTLGY